MGTNPALGLEVERLTVTYGGNVAVDDVSLAAPRGRITGLIGPNGAGKTTTFNACNGLLVPTHGVVRLDGEDITKLPPQRRAQRGIGRTFQRMELFDSLTAAENVAMGREAMLAGSEPLRHIRCTRGEQAEIDEAAEAAISLCGLKPFANRNVASLSTGQRRLVELARAMASGRTLLLLDEPSSGLDHRETDSFGDVLVELVETTGVGILLVEHDMSLVMKICTHLFVLDFGKLLFEGGPEEARSSEVVRNAYLGEAA
jgi:ABC-type branched-subunit amino acid transport system ATPase component